MSIIEAVWKPDEAVDAVGAAASPEKPADPKKCSVEEKAG